jgi:hypothetical protein
MFTEDAVNSTATGTVSVTADRTRAPYDASDVTLSSPITGVRFTLGTSIAVGTIKSGR